MDKNRTIIILIIALVSAGLVIIFGPTNSQSVPEEEIQELVVNVEQIRQAELTLGRLFNTYTPCSNRKAAEAETLSGRRAWKPQPCWVHVGWEPDGKVSGGYWVETNQDGFTAHGIISNNNGQFVEVVANKTDGAARLP